MYVCFFVVVFVLVIVIVIVIIVTNVYYYCRHHEQKKGDLVIVPPLVPHTVINEVKMLESIDWRHYFSLCTIHPPPHTQ